MTEVKLPDEVLREWASAIVEDYDFREALIDAHNWETDEDYDDAIGRAKDRLVAVLHVERPAQEVRRGGRAVRDRESVAMFLTGLLLAALAIFGIFGVKGLLIVPLLFGVAMMLAAMDG